MDNIPTISEAEFQIMQVIWGNAPISTNQVVEALEKTTAWKPKTVHTLLARLVKKGALQHEKSGKMFIYTPNISESDVLSQENNAFLDRFYNGTVNSMIVNLIEQERLTEEDMSELMEILEKKLSDER